jgi:toxin CcdB
MQCGVYKNPDESQSYAPYLLDVQADMLNSLETRIMVPLVRISEFGRRAGRLHPMFTIRGEEVVMPGTSLGTGSWIAHTRQQNQHA